MSQLPLTLPIYRQLKEDRISVESYLVLWYLSTGELTQPSIEENLIIENLISQKLCTETHLLDAGHVFLSRYLTLLPNEATATYTEDFELFWKTFPASDKWDRFGETRKLRQNKKETYAQYLLALNNLSAPELQEALEIEIKNKKESPSLSNPFKYMKASVNWLRDKEYENIVFPVYTLEEDNGLL